MLNTSYKPDYKTVADTDSSEIIFILCLYKVCESVHIYACIYVCACSCVTTCNFQLISRITVQINHKLFGKNKRFCYQKYTKNDPILRVLKVMKN